MTGPLDRIGEGTKDVGTDKPDTLQDAVDGEPEPPLDNDQDETDSLEQPPGP